MGRRKNKKVNMWDKVGMTMHVEMMMKSGKSSSEIIKTTVDGELTVIGKACRRNKRVKYAKTLIKEYAKK